MEAFYLEYMKDNPELFVVADDEDKGIVGFCMGYYMDNDCQMQNFLHNNRLCILWKTFLLLLIGNKQAWRRFFSLLKHKPDVSDWTIINYKYENISNSKRGDLLSVCVLPKYRGLGYAQKLMESYLAAMKASGCEICLLSVKTANERARHYYERNGFELYRTRGTEGLTYIKKL